VFSITSISLDEFSQTKEVINEPSLSAFCKISTVSGPFFGNNQDEGNVMSNVT
jgi:hypothetical protein